MTMSQIVSTLYQARESFEQNLKHMLVTDTLRNLVIAGIPKEFDNGRNFNDPAFKEKFNKILSPLSAKVVDSFGKVGSFQTGKVFSSIVNSINDTSSMEGQYRTDKFMNDIRLGNINIENDDINGTIYSTFENYRLNEDIGKSFKENITFILSNEDVNGIIDEIKENVKDSIAETEAKNELVKVTNQEILDYKREIAPPDGTKIDPYDPTPEEEDPSGLPDDDINDNGEETNDTGTGYNPNNAMNQLGGRLVSPDQPANPVNHTELNNVTPMENAFNLNLLTPESFVEKWIPSHAAVVADMDFPDKYTLASEMFNSADDVKEAVNTRFRLLDFSLNKSSTISEENFNDVKNRIEEYKKIAEEAYGLASVWTKSAQQLGITQHGLLNSQEDTICIARNIIDRFIKQEKGINPEPLPYISNENLLSNAFDLMQLRQIMNNTESYSPTVAEEYISRENLFFKNLLNWNDEEVKKKANAVIDMSYMKCLNSMSPNFLTDYNIKAWEMNVKENINPDSNAEVMNRVKEKFETLWGRPLNEEELKIVRATTNNEDVTEVCPTPFEKFVISLAKDKLEKSDSKSQEAFMNGNMNDVSKEGIKSNALLLTTLFMASERFGIIPENTFDEIESFQKLLKGE